MHFAVHEGGFMRLRSVLVVRNHRAMHFAVHVGCLCTLRSVLVVPNLGAMLFAVHVWGFFLLRSVRSVLNLRAMPFVVHIWGFTFLRSVLVVINHRAMHPLYRSRRGFHISSIRPRSNQSACQYIAQRIRFLCPVHQAPSETHHKPQNQDQYGCLNTHQQECGRLARLYYQ